MNTDNELDDDSQDPLEDMDSKDVVFYGIQSNPVRLLELEKATKREGWVFMVKHTNQKEPSFLNKANFKYMAENYPFLEQFDGTIGFDFGPGGLQEHKLVFSERDADDDDEDVEEVGDVDDVVRASAVEFFLFDIPQDDWDRFIEDAKTSASGEALDEEALSDLQFEALKSSFDRPTIEGVATEIADQTDWGYFAIYLGTVMTQDTAVELYNLSETYADFEDGDAYVDIEQMVEGVPLPRLNVLFLEDPVYREGWTAVKIEMLEKFLSVFESALIQQAPRSDAVARFLEQETAVKMAYLNRVVADSNYYDTDKLQMAYARTYGAEGRPDSYAWHVVYRDSTLRVSDYAASEKTAAKKLAAYAIETGFSEMPDRRPPDPDHPVLNFESASKLAASLLEADEDDFDLDPKTAMLGQHFIFNKVGSADGMDVHVTTDKELIERLYVGNTVAFTHAVVVVPVGVEPANATDEGVEGSWSILWGRELYARIVDDNGYTVSGYQSWTDMKAGALAAKAVIDLFLGTFDEDYVRLSLKDRKPEDVASDLFVRFGSPGDYDRFRDVDALPWREEYFGLDLAIEYGSRGQIDAAKDIVAFSSRRIGVIPEIVQPDGMLVLQPSIRSFLWLYRDEDEAITEYEAASQGQVQAPPAKFSDILLQLDSHSLDAIRSLLPGNTVTLPGEGPTRLRAGQTSVLDDKALLRALAGEDPALQPVKQFIQSVYEHAWQDIHADEINKAIVSDIEAKLGPLSETGDAVTVKVPWQTLRYCRNEARETWGYEHDPKPVDYLEQVLRGDAGTLNADFEWESNSDFHERFNALILERVDEVEMPSAESNARQTQMDL